MNSSPPTSPKEEKKAVPSQGRWASLRNTGCTFSEGRAKSLPLNVADRTGFCKGAHYCGYRINRKLAFWGAVTGRLIKLREQCLTELLFFCLKIVEERQKCPLRNSNEIWIFNTIQLNKYLLTTYSFPTDHPDRFLRRHCQCPKRDRGFVNGPGMWMDSRGLRHEPRTQLTVALSDVASEREDVHHMGNLQHQVISSVLSDWL